jgi:selenide,water dikinase
LAQFSGANFIRDHATGINTAKRQITFNNSDPLSYDYISIDIGITSALPQMIGFSEHGVSAKPLDQFAQHWQHFIKAAQDGSKPANVALIGGGVAGAELALAMAHALRNIPSATIALIDRSDMLVEMHARTRKIVLNALHDYGVNLHPETEVMSIESDAIVLKKSGETEKKIESAFNVSAARARPYDWVSCIGAPGETLDMHNGFISVDPYLRSSNERIFAVGDCAYMAMSPRPKAGVFAVRQAPILLQNLRSILSNPHADLCAYKPQKEYLKLMSLGQKSAVADKGGLQLSGAFIWHWKNNIDQKFMGQFNAL